MAQSSSSASRTEARALQMTAARALSWGLDTTDDRGTRFILLVPVYADTHTHTHTHTRKMIQKCYFSK